METPLWAICSWSVMAIISTYLWCKWIDWPSDTWSVVEIMFVLFLIMSWLWPAGLIVAVLYRLLPEDRRG